MWVKDSIRVWRRKLRKPTEGSSSYPLPSSRQRFLYPTVHLNSDVSSPNPPGRRTPQQAHCLMWFSHDLIKQGLQERNTSWHRCIYVIDASTRLAPGKVKQAWKGRCSWWGRTALGRNSTLSKQGRGFLNSGVSGRSRHLFEVTAATFSCLLNRW